MDELGGVIVGATVEVTSGEGVSKTTVTNGEGVYAFTGLAPGKYIVRASARGFAVYENPAVEVTRARHGSFDITLSVTIEREEVTVDSEANRVPGRSYSRSSSSSVVRVNGRVVSSSSVTIVNGKVVSKSVYPPSPADDDDQR
jgi:hypothetical protein